MKSSSKILFESMYRVLQNVWKETQAEDLRIYVSDANPLFCGDGISMDPVVSEDFDRLYEQQKNTEMSDYNFILFYLENLDPYYGDIKKYFVDISEDEFNKTIISLDQKK